MWSPRLLAREGWNFEDVKGPWHVYVKNARIHIENRSLTLLAELPVTNRDVILQGEHRLTSYGIHCVTTGVAILIDKDISKRFVGFIH